MLVVHLIAVVGVAVCVALGLWQWSRASQRQSVQSGFYAAEWLSFAVILIVVWVRTMIDELRPKPHPSAAAAPAAPTSAAAAAVDAQADAEMSAYNAYLAELAANPRR